MKPRSALRRKLSDVIVKMIAMVAAGSGITVLGWMIIEVILRGAPSLNTAFFTRLPAPPGVESGGLVHAFAGTGVMILFATLLSVPPGIMAGMYLAEFGKGTRLARIVRFSNELLHGMPSILIGLCVFVIVVMPVRHFSGYAGALALALLIFPVVTSTVDVMLREIPDTVREAFWCLGTPRWKVMLLLLRRVIRPGLAGSILLSIGKVSGETAPLLFTAFNSSYMLKSLQEPVGNLTVTIFHYALSPYPERNQIAWGVSLVIMFIVFILTGIARIFMKEAKYEHA